ncbi:MAG: hypothetical protein QW275_02995 [Candidatus Anstonellaceae archaeon]
MKQIICLFAVLLLFGCASVSPEIQPSNSTFQQPDPTPIQPTIKSEPEKPKPPEALPKANLTLPKPQPFSASAYLSPGKSISFPEGQLAMLDVWGKDSLLPVSFSLSWENSTTKLEFQLVAGEAKRLISPSGRVFWIYAKSTDAGATSEVKRAHVFILEAQEGEPGIPVMRESAEALAASQAIGWEVSSALLNRSSILRGPGGLRVQFEDMRAYPSPANTAMLKIWDDYSAPQYASLPLGHAYIFASPYSMKYAIYYAAGGIGEASRTPVAKIHIFAAGASTEVGKIYKVEDFQAKPHEKNLLGRFQLKSGEAISVTRDFHSRHTYLRMLDCGQGSAFIYAVAEDESHKPQEAGIIQKDHPLRFKDKFNIPYSAWLESASCFGGQATVLVYKE